MVNTHWLRHKDDPVWREKKRKEMRERAARKYRSTRPHLDGIPVSRQNAWLKPDRKLRYPDAAEKKKARVEAANRKQELLKVWHDYMIIRCKLCSRPFLRKDLPWRKCRSCVKAYKKVLQSRNPEGFREAHRAAKHRRRARLKGGGGSCSPAQWRLVLARFKNKCQLCGATQALTRDHIIPVSLGGSDDPMNLQPLCHPCNTAKGAKMVKPVQSFIPGIKSATLTG